MCGIIGCWFVGSAPALDKGLRRISHRGPDASGLFVDLQLGVSLGHAQLAIIDLSPLGHQSMSEQTSLVDLSPLLNPQFTQ